MTTSSVQGQSLPTVFKFQNLEIRVVYYEGRPWFLARDVASALGYADVRRACQQHCKSLKVFSSANLAEMGVRDTNPPGEYLIPEPDMYRLIIRSDKPEADRFERWVMEEVLPQIRKTGAYGTRPTPRDQAQVIEERLDQLSLIVRSLAGAILDLRRLLSGWPSDLSVDVQGYVPIIRPRKTGRLHVAPAFRMPVQPAEPDAELPRPKIRFRRSVASPPARSKPAEAAISPEPAEQMGDRWDDPAAVAVMLQSFRLRRDEMFTPKLISPDEAQELHRQGLIGPRQWARLRRHIVAEGRS